MPRAPETIAFDARMWEHPGIGRYIRELSAALLRVPDPPFTLCFLAPGAFARWLQGREKSPPAAASHRKATSRIFGLREHWEIASLSEPSALLHTPNFNAPLLRKKPWVVTLHDLIYLHDRRASRSGLAGAYLKFFLSRIEKKAAGVITVSEYTKADLLKHCPRLKHSRVFVIPEAPSPFFKKLESRDAVEAARKSFGLRHPYVLFVGSLKSHKNVPRLLRAMDRLRAEEGFPHELVLAGNPRTHLKDLERLIRQRPYVKQVGPCPDETLRALYNGASVLVQPSLWEGFGLPVLEAMACGCPVLASNRASLPEVAGSAGRLFDPGQVDALEGLLYNILKKKDLCSQMAADGLRHAQRFSWEKTAQTTLRAYRQLLA